MGTKGTKEWAELNLNIYLGCEHDCSYCYAKRMALRFNRIQDESEWKNMVLNEKKIKASIPKKYITKEDKQWHVIRWYMFPSSHDITPSNMNVCIDYLIRILTETSGNVLIVSKPHLSVIQRICDTLMEYRNRIMFRFTITSLDSELMKEYEPNAPSFEERLTALRYAIFHGYTTSVSIEPYLDYNPIPLIRIVAPYVNDTIWLGIMSGHKYVFHTKNLLTKIISKIISLPEDILKKVRLKDSIRNLGFELLYGT